MDSRRDVRRLRVAGRRPLLVLSRIVASLGVAAAVTVSPAAGTAKAGEPDLARGKKLFRKCVHCHSYKPGDGHRIGPNLSGLFGRKAGTVSGYDFSEAWKKADFTWSAQTLDTYLKAPHKMIPGNLMPFDGLNRKADRTALIGYLKVTLVPYWKVPN